MVVPRLTMESIQPTCEIVEWDSLAVKSVQHLLGEDEEILSPLLRLSPHDVDFPKPIRFEIPTGIGANKVFRSRAGRWELVETVEFFDTYTEVFLSHFSDIFVAGEKVSLKAACYVKSEGETNSAKLFIQKVACRRCIDILDNEFSKDEDYLQGFSARFIVEQTSFRSFHL